MSQREPARKERRRMIEARRVRIELRMEINLFIERSMVKEVWWNIFECDDFCGFNC